MTRPVNKKDSNETKGDSVLGALDAERNDDGRDRVSGDDYISRACAISGAKSDANRHTNDGDELQISQAICNTISGHDSARSSRRVGQRNADAGDVKGTRLIESAGSHSTGRNLYLRRRSHYPLHGLFHKLIASQFSGNAVGVV